jgi:hypothetical protein
MHYEQKWADGRLWYRHAAHGPWLTASDERMCERLRKGLELVLEATDIPEGKRSDAAWLRSALMAARGAAMNALGRGLNVR